LLSACIVTRAIATIHKDKIVLSLVNLLTCIAQIHILRAKQNITVFREVFLLFLCNPRNDICQVVGGKVKDEIDTW